MLIRLLVVVLTVVGPTPFRVCTCAASARSIPTADTPAPQPPHETKSCACGHRANAGGTTADADRITARSQTDEAGHSHPAQHERDCPAVSPRSIVAAAVQMPTADSPVEGVSNAPGLIETLSDVLARSAHTITGPPAPSAVPLYLSFCAFRN